MNPGAADLGERFLPQGRVLVAGVSDGGHGPDCTVRPLVSRDCDTVPLGGCVQVLEADIRSWIAVCDNNPRPFVWTKIRSKKSSNQADSGVNVGITATATGGSNLTRRDARKPGVAAWRRPVLPGLRRRPRPGVEGCGR